MSPGRRPGPPGRDLYPATPRDTWREKPDDAETGKGALLELVSEQTERLETLLAAHLERESAAGTDALGFQDTAEGERLRRYQMECNQTLLRILETPRKRHREADRAKEGGKRGRKSSGAASGVESRSEADLLRETFGPVIEPGARSVGECEPSSGAEMLRETFGRVNGRGQETLAQQSEAVPTTALVGRGASDPALSPTAGLPIDQTATNEATAPPLVEPSPTEGPPIPENAIHESNSPAQLLPARPTAALTSLALLLFLGLTAAFATSGSVIGADPRPRRSGEIEESRMAGVTPWPSRAGRDRHRDGTVTPRANDFVEVGGRPIARGSPMAYKVPNDRHRSAPT